MTLHFACDPATEDATATLLEWMQACPAPCFALLDMALLDPPQRQTLGARHRGKLVNAFANTPLAAFGEHAPHLLPLSPDPQQRSIEVTQLLGLIGITPALSWVRSDSPVTALLSLFGYLGKVEAEGRPRPVHCRFADVRILPGLLDDLAPNQQRRIAEVIQAWGWVNRNGQWHTWSGAPPTAETVVADAHPWLHLTAPQFASIRDRTEADDIFRQLMEQRPQTLADQPRGQLHKRLHTCLSTATELQVVCAQDRLEFVRMSLDFGDHFHRCEQLQPTWVSIRNGDRLTTLTSAWTEELWAILRAMA